MLVGVATGLAFAAKHTGFLAAPTIALLALVEWLRTRRHEDSSRFTFSRAVVSLAVIAFISVGLLWAFYGFRYASRPAGLESNPPAAEYIQGLSRPHEAKLLQTIAHYKLLPESYIYGLADVRMISDFYASYLLGKPYPHGVWFYFPVAMAIKSTVPFLLLLLITVWGIVRRKLPAREVWFLTIPPALYLIVAMSAHMNIGMRHVLPMYAFLTVLEAGAAHNTRARKTRLAVCIDHSGWVPDLHLGESLSRLHSLCQRVVGRVVADVALAQRFELGLGTTTESHQQILARPRCKGLLVCVFRRRRNTVPVLWNSMQAPPDARRALDRRKVL